jgi:Transcription-silencing protein, cryptic loci regulator Clr2
MLTSPIGNNHQKAQKAFQLLPIRKAQSAPFSTSLDILNIPQSIQPSKNKMLSEGADANGAQDEPLSLVPLLQRGPNGWSGQGQNFKIVNNVIKIKVTDASLGHVPSTEQRLRIMDDQGNFSQHVQVGRDDDLYKLWMSKIGPYLADWVLGKGRNGNVHHHSLSLFRCANPCLLASPSWVLLKFPEGYTLWVHKTGVNTDPANPRVDAYLHGAPHLGPTTAAHRTGLVPTVFRSPMEFVEHAIWLMKGREGQCLCKYCTPGQSQRVINRRLHHGLENDDDPDSDENVVEGDVVGDNAASASGTGDRTRGRGAIIRANRGRRARRDRSPPIMAKDYRVFDDGGAGPANP